MKIAYTYYFNEIQSIFAEADRILSVISPPEIELLKAKLLDAKQRTDQTAPLRVALIGEFNAGKSSLIGALTGDEVAIDADVCTDIPEDHPWRGLVLVDTPGIQAQEQSTDHDLIARNATVGADLVFFVVTNELFNPRLADYLRFVLDEEKGLGLAKKTTLIVNKIDRESNPEETLLSEIQKVLGPHQDVAVYFCAASKLLQAQSAPPNSKPGSSSRVELRS